MKSAETLKNRTKARRRGLLLGLGLVLALSAVGGALAQSVNSLTPTCTAVSTVAAVVLHANVYRVWWSIYTTSGAPNIYYATGSTATNLAVIQGTQSQPLMGGQNFTNDVGTYTGAVSAVAKSGSAWVCVQEGR